MRRRFVIGMFAFILCGMMTMLSSCSEIKLKAAVEAANSQCPMSLGYAGEMTKISYDDDLVVFTITMSESIVGIDMLANNPDIMKAAIKTMLTNVGDEAGILIDMIIDANANLCFKYIGRDSGKEASIILRASELKEMRNPIN